jgi:hypothetical protein
MSDLMIFVSTLGGLAVFGASGLIFGPVIAGLFVTIWKAIADFSQRLENGGDKQQIAGDNDDRPHSEPSLETDEKLDTKRSFKLTASKADLEAEVELLKRKLSESESE